MSHERRDGRSPTAYPAHAYPPPAYPAPAYHDVRRADSHGSEYSYETVLSDHTTMGDRVRDAFDAILGASLICCESSRHRGASRQDLGNPGFVYGHPEHGREVMGHGPSPFGPSQYGPGQHYGPGPQIPYPPFDGVSPFVTSPSFLEGRKSMDGAKQKGHDRSRGSHMTDSDTSRSRGKEDKKDSRKKKENSNKKRSKKKTKKDETGKDETKKDEAKKDETKKDTKGDKSRRDKTKRDKTKKRSKGKRISDDGGEDEEEAEKSTKGGQKESSSSKRRSKSRKKKSEEDEESTTDEEKKSSTSRKKTKSKRRTKSKREKSKKDEDRGKEEESKSDQSRQEKKQVRGQDERDNVETREPSPEPIDAGDNHHTQDINHSRYPPHVHENFDSQDKYNAQDNYHSPESRHMSGRNGSARNQMDAEEDTELHKIDRHQIGPIFEQKLVMSNINPNDHMHGGSPSHEHDPSQSRFDPQQSHQQNYIDPREATISREHGTSSKVQNAYMHDGTYGESPIIQDRISYPSRAPSPALSPMGGNKMNHSSPPQDQMTNYPSRAPSPVSFPMGGNQINQSSPPYGQSQERKLGGVVPQVPIEVQAGDQHSDDFSYLTNFNYPDQRQPIPRSHNNVNQQPHAQSISSHLPLSHSSNQTHTTVHSRQDLKKVMTRTNSFATFDDSELMEVRIPSGQMAMSLKSTTNGLMIEQKSNTSVATGLKRGDTIVALDGVDISKFSPEIVINLLRTRENQPCRSIVYHPGAQPKLHM